MELEYELRLPDSTVAHFLSHSQLQSSLSISGGVVPGPAVDSKTHGCSSPILSLPHPRIQLTTDYVVLYYLLKKIHM